MFKDSSGIYSDSTFKARPRPPLRCRIMLMAYSATTGDITLIRL